MQKQEDTEKILEKQFAGNDVGGVPQEKAPEAEAPKKKENPLEGQKLLHSFGSTRISREEIEEETRRAGLTRVGENIFEKAEFREGWIEVDRALLGERSQFYPSDWQFKIKPATVEAIRNWSTINEESANSIDDVFNEILKCCLSINTSMGRKQWYDVNTWDRLFFVLMIREYTMTKGDSKLEYTDDCPNCDNPVTFDLSSQSLMFDMPDPDVMQYYDADTRTWVIDSTEFGMPSSLGTVRLFVPTLEKDMNIKAWLFSKLQENRNYKIDQVMVKFLPWLCTKISKDLTIAKNQIRQAEANYKSWDIDTFSFMDEVLRNIMVTPSLNIKTVCRHCGEEVTSPIRFQNGIRSIFDINALSTRTKKFGKK